MGISGNLIKSISSCLLKSPCLFVKKHLAISIASYIYDTDSHLCTPVHCNCKMLGEG